MAQNPFVRCFRFLVPLSWLAKKECRVYRNRNVQDQCRRSVWTTCVFPDGTWRDVWRAPWKRRGVVALLRVCRGNAFPAVYGSQRNPDPFCGEGFCGCRWTSSRPGGACVRAAGKALHKNAPRPDQGTRSGRGKGVRKVVSPGSHLCIPPLGMLMKRENRLFRQYEI